MHIIHTGQALARLIATSPDPELKALLQAQADRLAEYEFSFEDLAMFAVIEPDDALEDIDAALGWSLLDGGTFSHPPELLDRHEHWFEVTFILSDDGYGLVLYAPIGTKSELRTACEATLG